MSYPRMFDTVRTALLPRDLYRHRLRLLDGTRLHLDSQRGRPTLLVNTASRCGFAGQLHALQTLHMRYGPKGLLVLGCPSADFGGHEYDDPADIALACHGVCEVEFPLTEPMSVRFDPTPFWADVAAQPGSGPPVWNYTKYLIGGDGRVRYWWSTNVRPEGARVREAIERLLGIF